MTFSDELFWLGAERERDLVLRAALTGESLDALAGQPQSPFRSASFRRSTTSKVIPFVLPKNIQSSVTENRSTKR